jgi:hypothetical protein
MTINHKTSRTTTETTLTGPSRKTTGLHHSKWNEKLFGGSPASVCQMDSTTQALDKHIPFDYTTQPDWPINPPLHYNFKVPTQTLHQDKKMQENEPVTAESSTTTIPNSTISMQRVEFPPQPPKVESKSYPNPQIISGNILHQTTKSVKIFTSSVSQNPALAFVDIKLSSPDNIKIKALHDSRCAKTVITHSVFEQLLQHGQIKILKPERQIVLISCTGEAQPIKGSADTSKDQMASTQRTN